MQMYKQLAHLTCIKGSLVNQSKSEKVTGKGKSTDKYKSSASADNCIPSINHDKKITLRLIPKII